MINPAKLLKLKGTWDNFSAEHPKFSLFLNAVKNNGLSEGTVIEVNITTADGKTLSSNIKLTKSDIELFRELSELADN